MKTIHQLRAEREQHLKTMSDLDAKATAAARTFTPTEDAEWRLAKDAVARIDGQIAEIERSREGGRLFAIDERGREIPVLRSTDRLFERHRGAGLSAELESQFSVAHLLRGVITGDFGKRELLQRAMNEGTGAAGQFTVPAPLAAQWIDLARAAMVCGQAGAITVPMDSQTLRIAGLATDVVPAFRAELTDFPTSNNTFLAIDLRARSIGVISEASIEVWADSPNIEQMVNTSIVEAMARAADYALLAGDGVTVSPADNPRGIINWPGIGATGTVGTPSDYSDWLAAMAGIAGANHVPASVIDLPATVYHLAGLATGITGDKTPLTAPAPYAAAQKLNTTAMPAGTSLVGDFTKSGWGMRESILVEATRLTDDALTKGKVKIRASMRLDTFVTHAAAFHKLTGITYA